MAIEITKTTSALGGTLFIAEGFNTVKVEVDNDGGIFWPPGREEGTESALGMILVLINAAEHLVDTLEAREALVCAREDVEAVIECAGTKRQGKRT